mgnify:CR=1 FL=1
MLAVTGICGEAMAAAIGGDFEKGLEKLEAFIECAHDGCASGGLRRGLRLVGGEILADELLHVPEHERGGRRCG